MVKHLSWFAYMMKERPATKAATTPEAAKPLAPLAVWMVAEEVELTAAAEEDFMAAEEWTVVSLEMGQ